MIYPTINDVLQIARQSECTRRKYGAVIVPLYLDARNTANGYNKRVGKCCNGICVRDRLEIAHGRNTDAGAEIHAEQMALISWRGGFPGSIYIAGLDSKGNPLIGLENGPCYVCARMIKVAGFNYVYLPVNNEWKAYSVAELMEEWELSWENQ